MLKLWMLGGWEGEMMDTGKLKLWILGSWEVETMDTGWLGG
jgi:hypothetical protein